MIMGGVVGGWGAVIVLFSVASTVGLIIRQRDREAGAVAHHRRDARGRCGGSSEARRWWSRGVGAVVGAGLASWADGRCSRCFARVASWAPSTRGPAWPA